MFSKPQKSAGTKSKRESGSTLNFYSKEEAEAEFKPYQGTTQRGYPYTGYEYDGEQYHDVTYMGEFDDDDLPQNDTEARQKRKR